jgi:hypothetical protein
VRTRLASISLRIPQPFAEVPGFYFSVTRALALANIPIIEIVNTQSEAAFILEDKHIPKAYALLGEKITIEYYRKD